MIRIEHSIPQIISNETWKAVQNRLKNYKHNAKNKTSINYLLTGKAFCGKCGMAMVGMKSKYTHYFYECSGKKRLKNCDKKNIGKEQLETLVAKAVKNALKSVSDREDIAKEIYAQQLKLNGSINPTVKAIKDKISNVSNKIKNINKAIFEGIWSYSTVETLKEFESEQQSLYLQLAEAEKTRVYVNNSFEDILNFLNSPMLILKRMMKVSRY
jgi:site-specific DNA recombinase